MLGLLPSGTKISALGWELAFIRIICVATCSASRDVIWKNLSIWRGDKLGKQLKGPFAFLSGQETVWKEAELLIIATGCCPIFVHVLELKGWPVWSVPGKLSQLLLSKLHSSLFFLPFPLLSSGSVQGIIHPAHLLTGGFQHYKHSSGKAWCHGLERVLPSLVLTKACRLSLPLFLKWDRGELEAQ